MIKKIIVYGCSISYGLNAEKELIYSQRLADELGVELINLSICGAGNIVNVTKLLNTDPTLFEDALVLFQTTYFERQILKDFVPNPYYNNIFPYEKDCNSYDKDSFGKDFDKLKINEWVGYWSKTNPPNGWKYYKEFEYEKWINYLKSIFLQNSIFLNAAHTYLKNKNIQHVFFDIPIPIMSYKLDFKDWYDVDIKNGFHAKAAKEVFSNNENKTKNCFYEDFINENFVLIDNIDAKNKITDIVIEPIYGNHTTIWKEEKFLHSHNLEQLGKPDGSHPSEKGHELIYLCLRDKLIEKGFLN